MYIVVDFDGTCVTHNFPMIGKDIGAVPVLQKLVRNGHKLILFTMRSDNEVNKYLTEAVQWFIDNKIQLFGVQTNPTQKHRTSSPKAYGEIIIDDAALGCPLDYNSALSTREFVDWKKVDEWLTDRLHLK